MKIENGKIIEATEDELFDLYLKRGMDVVMSFNDYKQNIKNTGCVVTDEI